MKYTARLENWLLVMLTKKTAIIYGECYEDEKGRFPDGSFIHTSKVIPKKYKEGDVVETLNSTYLLGKPGDA